MLHFNTYDMVNVRSRCVVWAFEWLYYEKNDQINLNDLYLCQIATA